MSSFLMLCSESDLSLASLPSGLIHSIFDIVCLRVYLYERFADADRRDIRHPVVSHVHECQAIQLLQAIDGYQAVS